MSSNAVGGNLPPDYNSLKKALTSTDTPASASPAKRRKLGEKLEQEILNEQMKPPEGVSASMNERIVTHLETQIPSMDNQTDLIHDFLGEIEKFNREHPKSSTDPLSKIHYYTALFPILYKQLDKLQNRQDRDNQIVKMLEVSNLINDAQVVLEILGTKKANFRAFESLWKSMKAEDRFILRGSELFVSDADAESRDKMIMLRRMVMGRIIDQMIGSQLNYDYDTRINNILSTLDVNGIDRFVFSGLIGYLDKMSFHNDILSAVDWISKKYPDYQFSDYDMNIVAVALAATNEFEECDNVLQEMLKRNIWISNYTMIEYKKFKDFYSRDIIDFEEKNLN